MRIHKNVFELIGNTPLVELTNYENNYGLDARIIAKVEYFEPAGSIKDRIAKAMVDEAEANGLLDADTVIIEPTSGNTGIGLAAIAAARGNRIIIVMPDTMSVERRKLMRAYGAELVLTPGVDGMKGAIAKAEELANEYPNSLIPSQFTNPANPAIHYRTTGPRDLGGYGWQGRHPGCRCWDRRHDQWHGRVSEGAEPGRAGRCRGAGGLARTLGRPKRIARHTGHRRRLRARDARHGRLR